MFATTACDWNNRVKRKFPYRISQNSTEGIRDIKKSTCHYFVSYICKNIDTVNC